MAAALQNFLLALGAGASAAGYGSALARFLRIRPNLGDRGILGLFIFGALGCALHFGIALSTGVELACLIAGSVLCVIFRHDIQRDADIAIAGATGLCLYLLVHPQALNGYDNGLYYLQTFLWNRQYPIVAGLANLHGRLGFNSLLFTIAPLTDRIEAGWITNFLALLFVLFSLFARLRNTDRNRKIDRICFWFTALFLCAFVLRPNPFAVQGILKADGIETALVLYWTATALNFTRTNDRKTIFALLVVVASLAAMIKLSALPLAAITLAIGIAYRGEIPETRRALAVASGAILLWVARGILLSGCMVYPVGKTCLTGLPWAVSTQQADDEITDIESWARLPGELDYAGVIGNHQWMKPWLSEFRNSGSVPLLLVGILTGILAIVADRSKMPRRDRDLVLSVGLGLVVALCFWFWNAPAVRFATGFIASLAFLGMSLGASAWLRAAGFYSLGRQAIVALMAVTGIRALIQVRAENYVQPIVSAAAYQIPLGSGARLSIPRTGNQCWRTELPCTPYVNKAILPRVRWPAAWTYTTPPQPAPPPDFRVPVSVVDTGK